MKFDENEEGVDDVVRNVCEAYYVIRIHTYGECECHFCADNIEDNNLKITTQNVQ